MPKPHRPARRRTKPAPADPQVASSPPTRRPRASTAPRRKPRPARRPGRAPRRIGPSTAGDHAAGPPRLQKVLAAAGVGSRRQCEAMILEGRVTVDGQRITELGSRVDPQAQDIRVDTLPIKRPSSRHVYFLVNKPVGVVSTSHDPSGRPRVIDLVDAGNERVFAVGRLDRSSEGLILVTNDGELANRLTHPRYEVEKTYDVLVAGVTTLDELRRLERGIHLAEGLARVTRLHVKSRRAQSTLLEMVLREGRNREIRRVLARVGHKVLTLRRVALGPLRLAKLPLGSYRPLTPAEVRLLREAADAAGRTRPRGPHGTTRLAQAPRTDSTPAAPPPTEAAAARHRPGGRTKPPRRPRRTPAAHPAR